MARPRQLITFFVATFAITWPCFSAVAVLSRGAARGAAGLRIPLLYLGIFAPAIVALLLTARSEGGDGVVRLLGRLVQWQVQLRWYLFAVCYIASVKLTAALLHRAFTGAWPQFGDTPWYLMLAATFGSTLLGGQTGEEIGWRGYALPGLAGHLGYAWASVLLGVIWSLWHLPLFFTQGADTNGQSFLVYLLQVTAISVAIAWLYLRTNGSLLLTMLMHSAVNNTKDVVPSALPGATNPFTLHASRVAWLTVALLWIAAAYFLFRMRKGEEGHFAHEIRAADGSPPERITAARQRRTGLRKSDAFPCTSVRSPV
jgi:membrane protease YdiL (CAAX protease family)